jgi:hypothetical protein
VATHGDFFGFDPPKSFASQVWVCIREGLVQGSPTASPARACSAV